MARFLGPPRGHADSIGQEQGLASISHKLPMMWTVLVRDPLFEMQGCELVEAGKPLVHLSVTPVPWLYKRQLGSSILLWRKGGRSREGCQSHWETQLQPLLQQIWVSRGLWAQPEHPPNQSAKLPALPQSMLLPLLHLPLSSLGSLTDTPSQTPIFSPLQEEGPIKFKSQMP